MRLYRLTQTTFWEHMHSIKLLWSCRWRCCEHTVNVWMKPALQLHVQYYEYTCRFNCWCYIAPSWDRDTKTYIQPSYVSLVAHEDLTSRFDTREFMFHSTTITGSAGKKLFAVNFSLFIRIYLKPVPSPFPLWFITWYLYLKKVVSLYGAPPTACSQVVSIVTWAWSIPG